MNPTNVAKAPPKAKGIIIVESAGIDKTVYDVPKAPNIESPVVL